MAKFPITGITLGHGVNFWVHCTPGNVCDDHPNDDNLDCDFQVLGLTVRVLEDLPLLLNPLAILTLRFIIVVMVTRMSVKIMRVILMTMKMMMIFQAWAGQARTKKRKLVAGKNQTYMRNHVIPVFHVSQMFAVHVQFNNIY